MAEHYCGRELALSIIDLCQTYFISRVNGTKAADDCSKILGMHTVKEATVNQEAVKSDKKELRSSVTWHEKDKPLVTPDEIKAMPDLTGYVRFSGDYPIAKFSNSYVERPDVSIDFLKKESATQLIEPQEENINSSKQPVRAIKHSKAGRNIDREVLL